MRFKLRGVDCGTSSSSSSPVRSKLIGRTIRIERDGVDDPGPVMTSVVVEDATEITELLRLYTESPRVLISPDADIAAEFRTPQHCLVGVEGSLVSENDVVAGDSLLE